MSSGDTDTEWVRPAPDRAGYRRDALGALLMLAGALVSVWLYSKVGVYKDGAAPWMCVLWAIVLTLPLALRRRFPVTVMAILGADFITGTTLHVPELLFSNIAFFIAFYTVGAWSRRRRVALVARAATIGVMFCWLFASLILGGDGDGTLSTAGAFSPYLAYGLISVITNLLYFGGAYYFGEVAHAAARQRAALDQRTAELTAERERSAAQAVALERVRIARDLHDVVAHHVSVMGVQAGAARLTLAAGGPDAQARAAGSLAAIESSARTAVDELHQMLGTLRGDDAGGAGAGGAGGTGPGADGPDTGAPGADGLGADGLGGFGTGAGVDPPGRSTSTRGLARLGELVDEAAAAGLPVSARQFGEPRALPGTVDHSAYRVVQEALTNCIKHAGAGARAEVRVRYLAGAVEVEITDDGLGEAALPRRGPGGLGQEGMRERVAAVGGRIEIGPRPRGGYRVRARFPTTGGVSGAATEMETETETETGASVADEAGTQ